MGADSLSGPSPGLRRSKVDKWGDAFSPLGSWHPETHFVWSQGFPKSILLFLLLFISLLSPALPAQPALSTLHEFHPPPPPNTHPKARSVEETFPECYEKKGEEGKRGRSWGGGFGERNKSFQIHIFFSFFKIFIMTHVYNTKYLDQEQGCRDTKSTFIAGRKDK